MVKLAKPPWRKAPIKKPAKNKRVKINKKKIPVILLDRDNTILAIEWPTWTQEVRTDAKFPWIDVRTLGITGKFKIRPFFLPTE